MAGEATLTWWGCGGWGRIQTAHSNFGNVLYNANDNIVGRSIDLYGEYARDEMELLKQIARPGDLVVDVGSGIGLSTLFFSRLVGPQGRVVAIEPQRVLFQNLCGNLAINGLTNTDAINKVPPSSPPAPPAAM